MTSYSNELWFGNEEQREIEDKIAKLTQEINNEQRKKHELQLMLKQQKRPPGACTRLKNAAIFSLFRLKKV
jgi:septal ring factor EnvC (AmiA/AmiB activator)